MIYNQAEKYCVKIKSNGHTGSGVLISGETTFYVFTAAHCLGEKQPNIEDITIEKQTDYKSQFNPIKVVDIKEFDSNKDFALIEIDFDEEDKSLYQYKLGIGFIPKTDVEFCGYQGINNEEYRPFPGKIITFSDANSCFKIKLSDGETFQQGGEQGQFIARGLSGSGVFIYRYKTPFLIGILNSVITDNAWNDDINCSTIKHIEKYLPKCIDLSNLEELKSWELNLEKEYTESEIDAFKKTKSDFFNKLYRKNKVLHPDLEKADKTTTTQIKRYLSMLQNIKDLENEAPSLYIEFKKIVKRYVAVIDENYETRVASSNEAIITKRELQKNLKDELDFLPNKMDIDFADFQIIEWLGVCTLNFTRND